MKNPWEKIKDPNFYTKDDKRIIDEFNDKLKGKNESPFFIDLNLMPEPYIGDPKANVILLFTNPGLKGTELKEYKAVKGFSDAIKKNLTHKNESYSYYYFNPEFKMKIDGEEKYIAGAEWIRRRTKELIESFDDKILAEKIFTIQLHPYHSARFKPLDEPLSVSRYTMYLFSKAVTKAKKGKAVIVCIRSYSEWNKAFQSLPGNTSESDLAKELGENFIMLKTTKDGKESTPRTPYFKSNYFRKGDFEKFIKMLDK